MARKPRTEKDRARDRERRALIAADPERREKHRRYMQDWHARNPHSRQNVRDDKYGLAPGQYDALLATQGAKCAICRQAPTWRGRSTLHVDHCHDTGQVRKLLCHRCNSSLGYMNDDPARLRAAAEYIEQHRSETQQVGAK